MSFRLVASAWDADIHSPGCKLVLMGLASYCNEDGECWPRQETLAQRTGQSVRTVRDHLAWLEANGYIQREHRNTTAGRRSDMYLVTIKATQPAKIAACATGEKQQSQPAKIAACSIHESVIKREAEAEICSPAEIFQECWGKLLATGNGVKYRAWLPKWTTAAKTLARIYKDDDFKELVLFVLTEMANDEWLRREDKKHHFNVQRTLRPDIFETYASRMERAEA